MRTWFEECPRHRLVIAEVAQAHDGSLGTAHAYVDAAADAGADAVKFQTHIAAAESTRHEPWRVRFSRQDETRYDYWKRMEFTAAQWRGLADHARDRGVRFLSSAFSIEAVDLLEDLGVPAFKVGSGELTNPALLRRMARTGKPVLLSTGMADWDEIDAAVAEVRACGAPLALFQCTSSYPCPPERLGLNLIAELRERYGVPVGLSDHSGTVHAGLGAVALGAELIEVHVAFSRRCFGPDVKSSVTCEELAQLVEGVRFLERALCNPVDKRAECASLAGLKRTFEKSVVAVRDLPAGHHLRAGDLALKKPGTGIPAARLEEVLGRVLARDVPADTPLTEAHLDT